ncbi:porin [Paraburkholderia fungorum]|uniref:porin n=1 Tax=Paraburkholderia fungorum TaxID=134537 RepID=UPI0020A6FFC8|nr:porin [Paraburkholderia fungorum]
MGIACTSAHAQSSVALYGILDAGFQYVTGTPTGHAIQLNNGGRYNSRWGLTGKEDLGNGLHAIFRLESGISINNGQLQQGGRLFGRQAFVGLDSDSYGKLQLGRQNTPMYNFGLALDPLGYSELGLAGQDPQFVGRADNAAAYYNKIGPVEGGVLYSFGYDSTIANGAMVPGEFRVGKQVDAAVRYVQGPVNATFSYEHRNGTSVATQSNGDTRYLLGGTYAFGAAKAYAGYELLLNDNKATQSTMPSRAMYYGGVSYDVTPAWRVSGAAFYHQFHEISAHTLNVGLLTDYFLSKRTSLYLEGNYVMNSAKANLSAAGTPTTPVAVGAHQLVIAAGIVQKF